MSTKPYFKDLSFLFFFNFLIKPIWVFAVDRHFQLWLGREEYGQYHAYLSLIYILSVILDMGLHTYTVKTLGATPNASRSHCSDLWIFKLSLSLIYLIFVIAVALLMKSTLIDVVIFLLVSIEMLIFSLYQYLRALIQGLHLYRQDSFLSSLDRVFLIVFGLSIIFIWNDRSSFTIFYYILFHIVAYLIAFLTVYLYFYRNIGFLNTSVDFKKFSDILKEAFPIIIITLLMTFYTRIDAVIVQNFLPNGDLLSGTLAFSNRIIDSANNTFALFAVFLLPAVSKAYLSDKSHVGKLVTYSGVISTVIAIGFIVICIYFSDEIYDRLYHTRIDQDIQVFKIQLWSILGQSWMYVFGSYLTGSSKYKQLMIIVGIGVLLSILFNVLLVPKFGIIGSAYVTSIVQLSVGVLHVIVGMYYLQIEKRVHYESNY